jgi:hypothetical protein
MPYFLYKLFPSKKLELITQFEKFADAKTEAKRLRPLITVADNYQIKVIFAKSDLEAVLLLKEQREARPLGDD